MLLVPTCIYHLTTVQKARLENFWGRVRLVPDHEVGGIETMIKAVVPLSDLVICCEYEQISCRLEYSDEFIYPVFRVKVHPIPFCNVIIHGTPAVQWYVAGRVLSYVIRRICQDEVDGAVRNMPDSFSAISAYQAFFPIQTFFLLVKNIIQDMHL